jgi:hypothetical protein
MVLAQVRMLQFRFSTSASTAKQKPIRPAGPSWTTCKVHHIFWPPVLILVGTATVVFSSGAYV